MPDMVNHPPHYTAGDIECIDAIRAALGPEGFVAYCRGTAIKYNWRAGLKDDAAQDLEKGAWYDQKGAEVAAETQVEPSADFSEVDRLKGVIAERDAEIQRWAEAQEAVRAQWVQVVEALGAIVPVIECETTLSMVKRIQDLVSSHKERLVLARNLILDARMFDCRCVGPCNCLSKPARKFQEEAVEWLEGRGGARWLRTRGSSGRTTPSTGGGAARR